MKYFRLTQFAFCFPRSVCGLLPLAFSLLSSVRAAAPDETVERFAFWDRLADWAIPAYFAAFSLAAAMMLIALTRRRPQISGGKLANSKLFQFGFMALLLLCALSKQTVIDNNRGFIADAERRYDRMLKELERRTDNEEVMRAQYLYMPTGSSLAYMTMGNPGLAADYLWLTSTQYVANNFRRGEKFEMLRRFYTTILELDPHWVDPLLNGGKVLSALEPDRFAVEKFYSAAVVQNPGDWRLPYAAGRLFVVPPLNLEDDQKYAERAVGWFKSAMQHPSFPQDKAMQEQMKSTLGLLSAEAGYYEAADKMLYQQATDREGDPTFRRISARDWMNVRSIRMAHALTDMAKQYKQQKGAFPSNLPDLLGGNPQTQAAFQTDAFGFDFVYNPETGKAESLGANVRKALTVHAIVETLIQIYRGAHEDKPPPNLEALRDWARVYYSNPASPPSHAVKDALGADLDPTRSPLGKWDYNPESGEITLPPWCNVTKLYLRTEEVMNMPPLPKDAATR